MPLKPGSSYCPSFATHLVLSAHVSLSRPPSWHRLYQAKGAGATGSEPFPLNPRWVPLRLQSTFQNFHQPSQPAATTERHIERQTGPQEDHGSASTPSMHQGLIDLLHRHLPGRLSFGLPFQGLSFLFSFAFSLRLLSQPFAHFFFPLFFFLLLLL